MAVEPGAPIGIHAQNLDDLADAVTDIWSRRKRQVNHAEGNIKRLGNLPPNQFAAARHAESGALDLFGKVMQSQVLTAILRDLSFERAGNDALVR